jgi:hypothetical protein
MKKIYWVFKCPKDARRESPFGRCKNKQLKNKSPRKERGGRQKGSLAHTPQKFGLQKDAQLDLFLFEK